jgi:hypothetical protein
LKKSLFAVLAGALVAGPLAAIALPSPASAAVVTEGFETVPPASWTTVNNSSPVGSTSVFQGETTTGIGPFDAHAGAPSSYAAMNFNSTTGSTGTISTWLVTPEYSTLSNGDVMSFYTRKPAISGPMTDYPDRLEVRMSTNGNCGPGTGSASVGDFTTLLTTINPSLAVGGYPQSWTQFTATLSGLAGAKSGCFAFRYFVTNAGPTGTNGDYIGIDTYAYDDQPTDVTPPDTSISTTPAALSNDTTPTFTFNASEASTFECSVDAAPYAGCTSPFTTATLGDGPHTFQVRAVDLAGNTDPTPSFYAFTVDTTAPETTITAGPDATTADSTPSFMFDSSEAGSSFQCSIDSGGFAPCISGVTIATPDDGPHTFEVRATDPAGNTDPTPASTSFTVDTAAPDTSITSGPGATTEDTTPTFGLGSSESGSTFACSVDGAAFAPCSGPGAAHTTAVLALGAHTFAVRATDVAGNTDATPATSSFSVVAPTPPTTTPPTTTPPDCSTFEAAVAKAKTKVTKAKAKLKKAKESGTEKAIKKAKAKLKKAKKAKKAATAALSSCQAG